MRDDHWERQYRDGVLKFLTWPLPEMVVLGARLSNGRKQAGLTQRDLAARSGVSQTVISRLERGVATGVSWWRVARIVDAIGPSFPFGFCPHHVDCAYPPDPRDRRVAMW